MVATRVRSDAAIQQAVIRELKWDTRVEETDVGVEVDEGVVTLTGTVSSYGKKVAAAEAAHRVAGVRDVANDIIVRAPGAGGRTDTDIAKAVRHALEWNISLKEENIESTVTGGVVTLRGRVDSYRERRDAEHAVRDLAGVRDVVNELVVVAPQPIPTAGLRQAIEEALERRAERTARRIRIQVDEEGVVTVRGQVGSWEEREAILGTVGHAPGVRQVRDLLVYVSPRIPWSRGTGMGWYNA